MCSCGYSFLLRPDTNAGWTDGKFLACVRRASRGNTAYFTADQFYAASCQIWAGKRHLVFGTVLMVIGVIVIAGFAWYTFVMQQLPITVFMFMCLFCLGIFGIGFGARQYDLPKHKVVNDALTRWIKTRGPLEKLITEPGLHDPPPDYEEPDIYDYGVERILIVQHDLMVDEMVLNSLHAELKALVISAGGYPWYLIERAQGLVDERTDLPVFVLHDATPAGHAVMNKLPISVDARRVVDLGLSEEDARNIESLKLVAKEEPLIATSVATLPTAAMVGLLTPALIEAIAIQEVLRRRELAGDDTGIYGYG